MSGRVNGRGGGGQMSYTYIRLKWINCCKLQLQYGLTGAARLHDEPADKPTASSAGEQSRSWLISFQYKTVIAAGFQGTRLCVVFATACYCVKQQLI